MNGEWIPVIVIVVGTIAHVLREQHKLRVTQRQQNADLAMEQARQQNAQALAEKNVEIEREKMLNQVTQRMQVEVDKLGKQLHAAQLEAAEARSSASAQLERSAAAEAELDAIRAQQKELSEISKKVLDENAVLIQQLDAANQKLTETQRLLGQHERDLESHHDLQRSFTLANQQIAHREEEIKRIRGERDAAQEKVTLLNAQLHEFGELQRKVDELVKRVNDLERENAELKAQLTTKAA